MKKIGYIFAILLVCTVVNAQNDTIDQEVIQDGEGIEYIYILTETTERPDTPALYYFITDNPDTEVDETERVIIYPEFVEDDFMPPGWFDDPLEPTEAMPYLWQCYRTGDWGDPRHIPYFTRPALWDQYGVDEPQGGDSDEIEFIYNRSVTPVRPPVPASARDRDGYVPPVWSDERQEVTAEIPYLWKSYRYRINENTWGEFSTPKPIAVANN